MRRALVAALLLAPELASANGRAPLTNGVSFQNNDPHSLYVRSTFGLLVSHDDGCSFRWVCEQSIGYGGEFDPKYAIAADGTIFATTFKGLRVSRDGGCSWTTATAEIWVDAVDIGPGGEVWIATAETASASDVYSSKNNGVTFEHRGMLSASIWWKSVKVTPTNLARVYITGYQVANPAPAAHLLRTDNGGASWEEQPLAGIQYNATPIVLVKAVDPTNADVVMMSSLGANGMGDILYRSTDAGKTFKEALRTDDTIRDVVFHGTAVFAATQKGSFESADGGATFSPMTTAPQLACLGDHDGQLVGCGANWQPDFMAVGKSADAASWSKLFRFVELAGPLACPAGTATHDMCEPLWPALRDQFAATGPTCGQMPDGPPDNPPKAGGGCSSSSTSALAPLGAGALVAAIALLVVRRRRRRR